MTAVGKIKLGLSRMTQFGQYPPVRQRRFTGGFRLSLCKNVNLTKIRG